MAQQTSDSGRSGRIAISRRLYDGFALRLTSTELVVYVALVRHWDPMSRVSAPSFAEIGRELGVDRGTVIRAMRTLEALGLARKTIRTGEDGGSLSNQYALPLEDQADDAEAASGRQA